MCTIPAAVLSVAAMRNAFGAAAVVLAWLALIGLIGPRASRVAIVLCGAALAGTLLATIALGVTYDPATGPTGVGAIAADAGLTERRLALWHDAWEAMWADPAGAGVGAFPLVSPTALADPDAVHAHNEFLERGAELGVAGLALTVLLFGWAFVRLGIVKPPDGVQRSRRPRWRWSACTACVDYVLHTPAVLLGAAALFGTGLVPRREAARS